MITIYEYAGCSTCRKALKFLDGLEVKYRRVAIVDDPPEVKLLAQVLARVQARGGDLKNLFNTSGESYRALKMGARLKAGLAEAEAMRLLAADGKLIKRPVLLVDYDATSVDATIVDATVGFDEDRWTELLNG